MFKTPKAVGSVSTFSVSCLNSGSVTHRRCALPTTAVCTTRAAERSASITMARVGAPAVSFTSESQMRGRMGTELGNQQKYRSANCGQHPSFAPFVVCKHWWSWKGGSSLRFMLVQPAVGLFLLTQTFSKHFQGNVFQRSKFKVIRNT